MVKLTHSSVTSPDFQLRYDRGGNPITGLSTLDSLNASIGIEDIIPAITTPIDVTLDVNIGLSRWYVFTMEDTCDILSLVPIYNNDNNIEIAEPAYKTITCAVPNDPLYPLQWGHNNTTQMNDYANQGSDIGHDDGSPVGIPGFDSGAEYAWDGPQGYGDPNIIIAILDNGFDLAHEDLADGNNHMLPGYDSVSGDYDPSAPTGIYHGTHMAGMAAAIPNNELGVAGIAGGCKILPVRATGSVGGPVSLTNGINWARDADADIISMSIAALHSNLVEDAIDEAYNAGVTLFAATNNFGGGTNDNLYPISFPASHEHVIAVGAASPCNERKRHWLEPLGNSCDNEFWWGPKYGDPSYGQDHAASVDLLGPTIMPTTDNSGSDGYVLDGDYFLWSNGTSSSCAYVAGVGALIKSLHPNWSPDQIRQ
ncbi:MAG: S8 family serine peptidase, partial [Fidelibacterota bacterium]